MPRRKDPRPAKALQTMRELLAGGWTSEALLIDGATEALGGGEEAARIAKAVWAQHFEIKEPI